MLIANPTPLGFPIHESSSIDFHRIQDAQLSPNFIFNLLYSCKQFLSLLFQLFWDAIHLWVIDYQRISIHAKQSRISCREFLFLVVIRHVSTNELRLLSSRQIAHRSDCSCRSRPRCPNTSMFPRAASFRSRGDFALQNLIQLDTCHCRSIC